MITKTLLKKGRTYCNEIYLKIKLASEFANTTKIFYNPRMIEKAHAMGGSVEKPERNIIRESADKPSYPTSNTKKEVLPVIKENPTDTTVFAASETSKSSKETLKPPSKKDVSVTESIVHQPVDSDQTVRRPREEIQKDLAAAHKITKEFDDFMDSLSPAVQDQVDPYITQISEEKIESDCPTQLKKVVTEARIKWVEGNSAFKEIKALEKEEVPYMKEELDTKVDSLLTRVDYDKALDHFRNDAPIDNKDNLRNFAMELAWVRRCDYKNTNGPSEEKDHDYYTTALDGVDKSRKHWQQQGIISDQPLREKQAPEIASREDNKELRHEIVDHTKEALEQLKEYGEMVKVYRPGHPAASEDTGHIDRHLQDVVDVLDFDRKKDSEAIDRTLKQVDFGSDFLDATVDHIEGILNEHGQEGRILKAEDELQAERQRIDAVDLDEVWSNVQFNGFEPPKGMVAVITPEEIIEQSKKIMPPDAVNLLQAISHEKGPKAEKEGIKTGEVISTFDTESTDWGKVIGTEIKMYRTPFVPEDATEQEKDSAKMDFVQTYWHESAHNAHYSLDYKEMKDWESIIKENPTPITDYIKRVENDTNRRKREDFCESQEMLKSNPALLHAVSESRFQYMYQYYERRLQTQQKEVFKNYLATRIADQHSLWEERGITPEQAAAEYLNLISDNKSTPENND